MTSTQRSAQSAKRLKHLASPLPPTTPRVFDEGDGPPDGELVDEGGIPVVRCAPARKPPSATGRMAPAPGSTSLEGISSTSRMPSGRPRMP